MDAKEKQEYEWEIQLLREKVESLKRLNREIESSKQICKVITKEGKNFRRLMVVETFPSIDGITLVVKK